MKRLIALVLLFALAGSALGQGRTLRIQAAWPQSSTFFDQTRQLADLLQRLSAGSLKIEALPQQQALRPEEIVVAVYRGAVDGAHAFSWYSAGADKTGILLSGGPGSFGMDHLDFLGWIHEGGGLAYYRQFYKQALGAHVEVLPILPAVHQPLGWFKHPIRDLADFKAKKCRQTGVNAEIYRALGMTVVEAPRGQIRNLIERGEIDCAEWAGGMEDLRLGLHRGFGYYYTAGIVERISVGELMLGARVWESLGLQEQEWLRTAANELFLRWLMRSARQNAQALQELSSKHNIRVLTTPPDVQRAMLRAWDDIAKREAERNPLFRVVLDSQRTYAASVVPARRSVTPPYSFLARYYWSDQPGGDPDPLREPLANVLPEKP